MWSVINRRAFLSKLDRRFVRRTSDSYGLDNIKPSPVPDVVKRPARLPFLKSLYAGQYDVEVLTYPETLNLERYKDLENRVQLIRSNNCTSTADAVRQLGLFGMSAPYPSSGLNLTETEIARVFEHFDRQNFGLVRDHTLAVDVVKTFGTPAQRAKYLPLLASGAVCSLHEDCRGVRSARLPNCRDWELTGTVENSAGAYALFVVGNAAFMVEMTDKLRADDGERLELRRVVVSGDDVLDDVDLSRISRKGKLYTCSRLVAALSEVFRSTVASVLPKNRLNMKLREFDSVLKTLGKSILNLYTVESMIYLTTWMTDGFDGPDVELETAAVQLFVRQTANATLNELKMLCGRNSIREPFATACNDVEDLIESLQGTAELAAFISARGVEFLHGSDYKENISFITQTYRNIMMKRGEPSLKYGLKQFVHPALMYPADFLEECVLKFQYVIDRSHAAGQLSTDDQMLMERLSTVIAHIYAMTAVLGRTSRSYCTGIRFSDYEMNIGETVVRESYALIKPIIEELVSGEYIAKDSMYESFADQILNDVNSDDSSVVKREQTKT